MIRLLAKYGVLSDLLDLTDSFLWNRSIVFNANQHFFNVGVPQGSCLIQIFWLVLINSLLKLKRLGIDEAWTTLVFAMTFILACSPAVCRFADIVWQVPANVHSW